MIELPPLTNQMPRLFRLREVAELTGLRPDAIRRLAREGAFPAPVLLPGAVQLWREDELRDWIDMKSRERDAALAAARAVDMRQAHDELAALHARQAAERAAARGKDGT